MFDKLTCTCTYVCSSKEKAREREREEEKEEGTENVVGIVHVHTEQNLGLVNPLSFVIYHQQKGRKRERRLNFFPKPASPTID